MLRIVPYREQEKHEKELRDFCKKNHCLMFNIMRHLKQYKGDD